MVVVMVLVDSALAAMFFFDAWFEMFGIEYVFTVVTSTADVGTLIPDAWYDVVTDYFVDGGFV